MNLNTIHETLVQQIATNSLRETIHFMLHIACFVLLNICKSHSVLTIFSGQFTWGHILSISFPSLLSP